MATTISGQAGGVLGDQQTWQNLTSSRALDTQYQNTTGKPIVVSVVCQGQFSQNFGIEASSTSGSGFVLIGRADCGDYYSASGNVPHNANVQGIIPANWYYKASNLDGATVTLVY